MRYFDADNLLSRSVKCYVRFGGRRVPFSTEIGGIIPQAPFQKLVKTQWCLQQLKCLVGLPTFISKSTKPAN